MSLRHSLAPVRFLVSVALWMWLAALPLRAASKPHVVGLGKWQTVKWFADAPANQAAAVEMKVRPLYVDAKLKETTVGLPHEVTDRVFVVRRAYRVNDSLPAEDVKVPHWRWQLGGWLQVDRGTGRVSALNLPDFDPEYSVAAWYREYAAYCGVSDDGKKLFALVAVRKAQTCGEKAHRRGFRGRTRGQLRTFRMAAAAHPGDVCSRELRRCHVHGSRPQR